MNAADVLMYVSAGTWALFVVLYGLIATWWKTPFGRNTVAVSTAMALVLVQNGLSTNLGEYAGRTEVRMVLYSWLILLALHRVYLLVKAQMDGDEYGDN